MKRLFGIDPSTLFISLMVAAAIVLAASLPGCATDPETGERVKVVAPSPEASKALGFEAMDFVLSRKELTPEKLESIKMIMVDSKSVLMNGLKEDPQNLEMIRLDYLKSKNPEAGRIANTVLTLLVTGIGPLIDKGKTDLAASYIQAVLEGAVLAINLKLESMA